MMGVKGKVARGEGQLSTGRDLLLHLRREGRIWTFRLSSRFIEGLAFNHMQRSCEIEIKL